MTFFRAFLFAYGGIKAAKVLHNKLLHAMMDAPIPFFDKTPVINIENKKTIRKSEICSNETIMSLDQFQCLRSGVLIASFEQVSYTVRALLLVTLRKYLSCRFLY